MPASPYSQQSLAADGALQQLHWLAAADASRLSPSPLQTAKSSAQGDTERVGRKFEKVCDTAEAYAREMARLRERLHALGVTLPKDRFRENNAELMRFAVTLGLCEALTEQQREQSLEKTAERVQEAVEWLRGHEFLRPEELERWKPLLFWAASNPDRHPLLVIRLGRATRECGTAELEAFAEAIVSQVQAAVGGARLSDEPGRAEQMVVVADCQGASTLQASHVLKLIKHVSLTLNRHYPGRLHRFYLVDLPRMIRWPVKAIIALGHPATRDKVVLCASDDPRLPPEFRSGEEHGNSTNG